jgi:hypothetical protein
MRKLVFAFLSLVVGVAVGLFSAIYRMNDAGAVPVSGSAGWVEYDPAATADILPYAFSRLLIGGQVPPSNSLRQFMRRIDEDGNGLRGDCAFFLEGSLPAARWWTISATDGDGRVMLPKSTIAAGQTLLDDRGSMLVTFAPWPISGNWIAVGPGSYNVVLTLHDAAEEDDTIKLPTIRKGRC